MPDVAHTSERERRFSFHQVPVLSDWFQVYAMKGSGINSIIDLENRTITVLERSIQQEAFEKIVQEFSFSTTLIPLPDYEKSFEEVAQGRADAAITNRFYGVVHAREQGLENTAIIFNPTQLFFAAPLGISGNLLSIIDQYLFNMKQDTGSVYYSSLKQWTEEEADHGIPEWIYTLGYIVAGLLALSLTGSAVLKHQVNARTRELRKINLEMESRIAERTEELARAMERAQAADRIKSDFLATMSHEIRTPMNAVIGFAYLVEQEPLSRRQQESINKLSSAARHLLQIINDILDFSKIEAGKLSLENQDFEPSRVIDHACSIVAQTAARKNLDLNVFLEQVPAVLKGDGLRIGQILLNLMGNAVKFTETGYINLTARKVNEIDDRVVVRFEVQDTGIGMSEEQLQRLFKSFSQADNSTTRRFGGTGLGLAITKRLIEAMGGTLGVDSQEGRGSCFWVEIPLKKTDQLPPPAIPYHLKNKRVLIVDDLKVARESIHALTSDLGMRPDTADSGTEGLEAVHRADMEGDPYDLLLVDWKMPGMTGTEMIQQLESLPLDHVPRYFLISAFGEDLSDQNTGGSGILHVLPKPLTPSILLDALQSGSLQPEYSADRDTDLTAALADRKDSHLLLVEDNPINQDMTTQVLEAAGMMVSIASDGKQAVNMASDKRYDLVLMDIQMPVMDGLAATVAIRRLPGWADIPIIAMTANVFTEDRDRCLKAGMNDHLPKPLEMETLYRCLIKWLKKKDPAPLEPTGTALPADPPTGSTQDRARLKERLSAVKGLDAAAGIKRVMGDPGQYLRLLSQMVDRHEPDPARIAQQMAAGDLAGVRHTAHALKGVAAMLGAGRITAAAQAVENAARKGRADWVSNHLPDLTASMDAMARSLAPIVFQEKEPAPSRTVDPGRLDEIIHRLVSLLKQDSTDVNDLFDRHYSLLTEAFGEKITPLARQIQEFDYPEALETLQTLTEERNYQRKI